MERASCAPRALAKAVGLDMQEALLIYAKAGRKKSCGTPTTISRKVLKAFGRKQKLRRGKTLARFAREHAEGKYIVRVRRHMLAIIDGVISDHTAPGSRVLEYWKVQA